MPRPRTVAAVLAAGVSFAAASSAALAQSSIGIDWFGAGGNGGTAQSPMGAGEVAGVVPQDNWNSFTGQNQPAAQALVDDAGAATGATVVWTSPAGQWDTNIADTPGNLRMMLGYLDTNGVDALSVTVSNLPASITAGGYEVYAYADGDNGTEVRPATYAITGSPSAVNTDGADSTFAGTFVQGTNYVRLTGLTASSFTLTATPNQGPGTPRAPLNGIQIVAVPEPSAVALLGLGAAALLARRRRRR
jgi:hypothetical protein